MKSIVLLTISLLASGEWWSLLVQAFSVSNVRPVRPWRPHAPRATRTDRRTVLGSSTNADFAYQELKILLTALRTNQRVRAQDLNTDTVQALVRFVQHVTTTRIHRDSNRNAIVANAPDASTVWTLAFTTDTILPRDATVQLTFPKQTNDQLCYSLVFGERTMGLNRIDVACSYRILMYVNDIPALEYTYETVSMDAFGYRSIDLCWAAWFLQGRSQTMQTVYVDNVIWIERVADAKGGDALWNVYWREDLV